MVSFIQVIFIYILGIHVKDQTESFVFWLSLTMIVNTVWIAIAMRIGIPYSFYQKVKMFVSRTEPSKEEGPTMPKTKVDTWVLKSYNKIPLEWLHLNILTTGFLIVLLYLLRDVAVDGIALFILVILLIVRVSSDYMIGWNGVYMRRMYYRESSN